MRAPAPPSSDPTAAESLGIDPTAADLSKLDFSGMDPTAAESLGIDPTAVDLSKLDFSGMDPALLEAAGIDLSGLDPATLSQQALHPWVQEALGTGAGKMAMISIAVTVVLFAIRVIQTRIRPTERSPGPTWVAAALMITGLYLAARAIDPLLVGLLDRPQWMAEAAWAKVGWFEWKLLGRPGIALALPLANVPALALALHVPLWLGLLWFFELILGWVYGVRAGGSVGWHTARADLPWFYRWVGASTARRADQRFRRWVGPLVTILIPLHVIAGLSLGEVSGPAPGTWVVAGVLLWVTAFHLVAKAKRPQVRSEEEEEDETTAEEASQSRDPLERLREAAQEIRPGVTFELIEEQAAAAEVRASLPAALAPLVSEIFEDLCGQSKLWAHQAAVLEHLSGVWTLRASAPASDDPTSLEEVHTRSPISIAGPGSEAPHALVQGGEGSGRTTLTILAALHVFLDRGATTLVIVRSRAAAIRWTCQIREALARSSARWNVQVALAAEDLAAPLLAGRTPAIVVADLEAFESEVLCDRRSDDLLARLGLVVVDDVDAFHGVAEMHLGLSMRRLWALDATLHAAPYPVVLLATSGVGASGLDGWARHVLGVRLQIFADDRAPARSRVLLRRRDLVDARGDDLPLAEVAQACEAAGLTWHLRLAGDDGRRIQRAALDGIGGARRHYQRDPADAAVVLIEGTYPAVRREALRLRHAGWRQQEVSRIVLVLAPPGDEEMVLHEEADDALHRELVSSLPQAVPLSEPRVVRQRHLDRALGREQDLAGLRERLGAHFVDEAVENLAAAGKVRRRQVLQIDARTDTIVERTLVRSDHEAALGQAITAECVTEEAECVSLVDAGTSEVLLRCELAIARAVYPPGRIFLHARGRYIVVEGEADSRATITAERIADASRTTLGRRVQVEIAEGALDPAARNLGGQRLWIALCRARIREEIVGVRRLGPGPRLLEQRTYEHAISALYGTDVCLLRGRLGTDEGGPADPSMALSAAAAAPLVAALRMMIPCALRGAGELVDVAAVDIEGELYLCFFDRTPGASGFARHIAERSLSALLILARLALGRLVGPELGRLWHIHDSMPEADPSRWELGGALRWLAAILDRPAPKEHELGVLARPMEPRCEYSPGVGRGDLGRIWATRSGRSDDLVWTRHRWWSPQAIGDTPAGEIHLDIAIERPLIARALRAADDPEVLATLAMIRASLTELLGERSVDGILGMVAALPWSVRPLAKGEGSALVVLARRRADLRAKVELALALLPEGGELSLVEADGEAQLRLGRGAAAITVDLRGPQVKRIEPAPSS